MDGLKTPPKDLQPDIYDVNKPSVHITEKKDEVSKSTEKKLF